MGQSLRAILDSIDVLRPYGFARFYIMGDLQYEIKVEHTPQGTTRVFVGGGHFGEPLFEYEANFFTELEEAFLTGKYAMIYDVVSNDPVYDQFEVDKARSMFTEACKRWKRREKV